MFCDCKQSCKLRTVSMCRYGQSNITIIMRSGTCAISFAFCILFLYKLIPPLRTFSCMDGLIHRTSNLVHIRSFVFINLCTLPIVVSWIPFIIHRNTTLGSYLSNFIFLGLMFRAVHWLSAIRSSNSFVYLFIYIANWRQIVSYKLFDNSIPYLTASIFKISFPIWIGGVTGGSASFFTLSFLGLAIKFLKIKFGSS